VPYLAFGQFDGSLERLNRSYAGENDIGETSPLPFFETNKYYDPATDSVGQATSSSNFDDYVVSPWDVNRANFYQTLGLHTQATTINSSYVQAYNAVINHRRKARSPAFAAENKIRNEFDHRLAECFWPNSGNSHIVADYDEKLIAGEVNLKGLTFKAPIRSQNYHDTYAPSQNGVPDNIGSNTNPDGDTINPTYAFDEVWAELTSGGSATMNLADIELAKNLASFAKLRSAYSGRSDEWIIDMLMQGISMPLEMLKDPLLVGQSSGVFNMAQRFASDAGNLDDSVTRGICNLNYRVNMPRTSVGGILVTTVEIAPEQVWERKKDYFLYTTSADELPNALKDNLSILGGQHAVQVKKDHLDVNHSTPDAVLGFAPLNHEWRRDHINLGGKLYRPADDAYTQDRARVWSNEVSSPNLSTDFYLCTNLHKKVFSDQTSEAFEITAMQDLSVNTNIQFGDALIETDATSDYDAIETLVNG
jgi:hypothetical protein